MIRATRTPQGPAPLVRHHGLPFVLVVRNTIALTGEKHGRLGAAWLNGFSFFPLLLDLVLVVWDIHNLMSSHAYGSVWPPVRRIVFWQQNIS
jgi:hypothetical protein